MRSLPTELMLRRRGQRRKETLSRGFHWSLIVVSVVYAAYSLIHNVGV